MQAILASLAVIGKNNTEEDLSRLDGPDPYESELTLMAEVSAYFRVAYKVRIPWNLYYDKYSLLSNSELLIIYRELLIWIF